MGAWKSLVYATDSFICYIASTCIRLMTVSLQELL